MFLSCFVSVHFFTTRMLKVNCPNIFHLSFDIPISFMQHAGFLGLIKEHLGLIWLSLVVHHQTTCNILQFQRPSLIYCLITELNCNLMWLVYVGAHCSEPSSALHVKGLSVSDEASPTLGRKSASPRKRDCPWVRIHSAAAPCAHKQTHILHRVNSTSFTVLAILEGWVELSRIW